MIHDKIKQYGVRIVIICLSMLFLSTYIAKKEGYHVDEILSFQVGNSEFTPWIMPTQPVGRLAKFVREHIEGENIGETIKNIGFITKDTLQNRAGSIIANYKADVYDAPVWIDREHFKDYLECDRDDAFNLLSVYYNAKDDIHPPLYYMTVHLMCSVFQGNITVWHGCVINMIALAVTMWLLGCIGDMLFQRKSSTIALLILYGFSSGIIASVLWVRMYALLTLWLVWLLYLHIRKMAGYRQDCFLRLNKKGRTRFIGSWGILVATLVIFWTNYFGLFFLLPLAGCTFILLLKAKRFKECLAYVRTMIIAAIIGLGCFPFAVSDVFQSAFGSIVLSQLEDGVADYLNRLRSFAEILGENVAGGWLFLLLAFLIGFGAVLYGRIKKKEASVVGNGNLIVMCAVPTLVFFLLDAKMSPHFVERYFMPLFPLAILLLVLVWEKGLLPLLQEKRFDVVCIGLALVLLAVQVPDREWKEDYFRTGYKEQLMIAEKYKEYPMVCMYAGYSLYENIFELQKYKQSILVQEHELAMLGPSHKEPVKDGYVAVIKYPRLDDKGRGQLETIVGALGGKHVEYLGIGKAYGDAIYLVTP